MSNNSDNKKSTDLTELNAETEFQRQNTFKITSKCDKIFGRVGNIFMTLIDSNFYKSDIQSQLHDLVGDSLSSISKFVISYGESKTWDEWATYFEHQDLDKLSLRETGIFLALCNHIQQILLDKVSNPDFSWDSISAEEKVFHIGCASELQDYLYKNSKRSTREKIVYNFVLFRLCNNFWINFFDIITDYNELCHEYIHAIFNANREYLEKNIAKDKEIVLAISDVLHDRQQNTTEVKLIQENAKLNDLANLYNFTNYEEAKKYLVNNADLLSLLKDAYSKIVEYFESTKVSLSFTESVDISESFTLKIRIKVNYDLDSATNRRHSFNDDYWFDLPFNLTKNTMMGFEFE
jgi:hypothetical protein